jgi:hypothetical protein
MTGRPLQGQSNGPSARLPEQRPQGDPGGASGLRAKRGAPAGTRGALGSLTGTAATGESTGLEGQALWRHTPGHAEYGRQRTPFERRTDRANGVDRFGKPLPRATGTNPRALGTNPRACREPWRHVDEELPPAA